MSIYEQDFYAWTQQQAALLREHQFTRRRLQRHARNRLALDHLPHALSLCPQPGARAELAAGRGVRFIHMDHGVDGLGKVLPGQRFARRSRAASRSACKLMISANSKTRGVLPKTGRKRTTAGK